MPEAFDCCDAVDAEQEWAIGRFQQYVVPDGSRQRSWLLPQRACSLPPAPGVAIEVVQHRAAPVTLRLGWGGTVEAHIEGNLVGVRQFRDAAGTHFVGKAGLRAPVIGHGPQGALQARHQQEAQRGKGQRQQQGAAPR